MTTVTVIYHANCADGFTAAWLVHREHPDVELIPAQYGDVPPDVTGKRVMIVDFSYPRETLLKMYDQAHSLVVLDHHKTAEEELKDLHFATFDMDQSGASLTYEYLNIAAHNPDKRISLFVDMIEDRDLWRFKLPDTQAFSAGLKLRPMTLESWDQALEDLEQVIKDGQVVMKYEEMLVRQHLKRAKPITLFGVSGYVTQCSVSGIISALGNELAKLEGSRFGLTYFYKEDTNEYIYSIRAIDEDVGALAKRMGGGGHRLAAGFKSFTKIIEL